MTYNFSAKSALCLCLLIAVTACQTDPVGEEDHQAVDDPFNHITEEIGLGEFRHTNGGFGEAWAPEITGAGVGVIDYDSDGWPDLLLVSGGAFEQKPTTGPAVHLYRNNEGASFSGPIRDVGLDKTDYAFGVAVADYDNDGDQDFLLTSLYANSLYRNEGGRFVEVAASAGLAEHAEWSSSAAWLDADNDGWIDLFVANYVDWSPEKDGRCMYEGTKVYCTPEIYDGVAGRFYRSNKDGTFTERTREAGFSDAIEANLDKGFGATVLDYNRDGWMDLAVASDTERDLLFENDGDGTFTEHGVRSGISFSQHGKARAGMGIDAGVVDETGETTIFVGNFSDETLGVYRHAGDGLFTERAAVSKVGHASLRTLTFGLFLFDGDLDGDLDLVAANGHVQTHIEQIVNGVSFRQPIQLYWNDGDGTFDEVMDGDLRSPIVGRGAAYLDYDRDGDQDIVVTENDGPVHFFANNVYDGNYVALELIGVESNRSAIGARVVLYAGGTTQERIVRSGFSYLSSPELQLHFGLGELGSPDSLQVFWPSGQVQTHREIDENVFARVVEGQATLQSVE